MNKEIELKAWVEQPEIVRTKLESLYGRPQPLEKDDIYYIYRHNTLPEWGQPVRLRTENGINVVTLKQKSVSNGIECNNELEFEVDKPENFIKYMQLTGADAWLTKKKRGWKFAADVNGHEAVIELCEVLTLGWFLEIEIVLSTDNNDRIAESKAQIMKILNSAGVSEDRIESRFYSELLKGK
ncbi:MAG TPA: class IV adenylate cyclase [Spirochaeta sp.]|nr:class IV adenylate cyclase [Spirochaeta sp.]